MDLTVNSADNASLPNNSTMNDGDTSGDGGEPFLTPTEAVYYVLSIGILVLFCVCSRSRIPDQRLLAIAAERRARWQQRQERKNRMSDPEYRTKLILKGLVLKKITEEKDGFLTLGDYENGDDDNNEDDHSSASGSLLSIDSMDEKSSSCAICLEPFRVKDVVGLSSTILEESNDEVACNHAFHKACIVAWLMNPLHDECPSCRSIIVREEEQAEISGHDAVESNDVIMKDGTDHHSNWAFVIVRGLVSRVRHASLSLVGQNIGFKEHDDDIERGRLVVPDTPPSPFRRVYSLEGSELSGQKQCTLRRRTSLESFDAVPPSSSMTDVTLPDVLEDSPLQDSPFDFRRVVSDFGHQHAATITSIMETTSAGVRPFSLAFRPRAVKINDLPVFDNSERSEDPITIQEGFSQDPVDPEVELEMT